MDNLNNKDYQEFAEKKIPKPTYTRNIIFAFLVGGAICTFGEAISNYLENRGLQPDDIASAIFCISFLIKFKLIILSIP